MKEQLAMLDSALEAARPDQRTTLIREFTKATESRLRFYGADGRRVSDSFASGPPTYTLRDPELQPWRSEEHASELQSLMRISYAVFCLKKKNTKEHRTQKIIKRSNTHTRHNTQKW